MKLERVLQSAALVIFAVELLALLSAQNIIALVLAICLHEFGHLLAISLMGMKIKDIHVEPCGLCIDYMGINSWQGELISALAGPLLGLFFYFVTAFSYHPLLELSGRLSLLYSAFNLLPAKPLDGGRIFAGISEKMFGVETGELVSKHVSILISALLLVFGFSYSVKGEGNAVLAAGLWLLLLQSQN